MRRRLLKKDQLQDLVAYDFYVRAVSLIYNAQLPSHGEFRGSFRGCGTA